MKSEIRSIQLSVRGKPSAFDLSRDGGMAVVASPGCMTFFDLDGLGVPRHYIYYEQQTQVRRIRYQKEGLLAALRGGAVSIWDPSHSLRPLLGLIHDSDWITNLEWGSHNAHLIATCCDGGDGKIFDARSPHLPVQTISVGGICQKISWSNYDSNYIAISNEKKVTIFDLRMIGSQNVVTSHEVPEGVIQFAWCAKEHQAMVIGGRDGSLSWLTSVGESKQETSTSQGGLVDEASLLFSTPVGVGAVVCRYEYMGSCTQQEKPFFSGPVKATDQGDAQRAIGSKKLGKFESSGVSRSESRKVVVNLIGHPANKGVGSPGGAGSNTLQLAQCPDPVVGVRWGNPGRLIPPMHNGQEMLFLSTSSCLHAVAVPAETMNRFCCVAPGGSGVQAYLTNTGKKTDKGGVQERKDQPLLRLDAPKFSLSGLKRYVTPVDPSGQTAELRAGQAASSGPDELNGTGTVLSLSGEFWMKLQDSVLLLQKRVQSGHLEGLSIDLVDKYARQITLYLERPDSAPFSASIPVPHSKVAASEKAVHSGNAFSDFAAIASVDDGGATAAKNGLASESEKTVKKIEDEDVTASPKKLRKGSLEGKAGSSNVAGQSEKEKRINDRADRIERGKAKNAALIISFPPNYPQSGYPTFTLRSGGLASSSSSLRSDIIAELASIAKGSTLRVSVGSLGEEVKEELTPTKLLFDVAECFRCRTLQYWGVKINVPPPKAVAQMPSQVSFLSADSVMSGLTGRSPTRKIGGSGSFGDLGLDIDASEGTSPPNGPIPTQGAAFEEVPEATESVDGATASQCQPAMDNVAVESEHRRRIGGDDMYDDEIAELEKQQKEEETAALEGGVSYSKATIVIDPLAYYVPCPASSGGFFAPSGALMTFGGAKFVVKIIPKDKIEESGLPVVDTDLPGDEDGTREEAKNEGENGGGVKFMQNMYPKSYADMLLRQREREFYESEKTAEDERWKLSSEKQSVSPRKKLPSGELLNPRPIVKSSSGVFFVDRNLNSDMSGSEEESTEDESLGSESEDSSSNDESGDDYAPRKTEGTFSLPVGASNSLYRNSLLYGAEIDIEAISATLDEEQLIMARNGSNGSSAVDLSSLDALNGEISGSADARRKRFLVAEALQVSSKNPTVVEIYSKGFETYQALADIYDLGPMSAKTEYSRKIEPGNAILREDPRYKDYKKPNALFAQFRTEVDGSSRLRNSLVGMIGSRIRSPSKGIAPLSHASAPVGAKNSVMTTRLRSSSSFNDLLINDSEGFDEDMHSRSADKDSTLLHSILFPADVKPGEDASSQSLGEHKRTVTWSRNSRESGDLGELSSLAEESAISTTAMQSGHLHRRQHSSGLSTIQQLPFSMADLDVYSGSHKDEDSEDMFDDYRIDDFTFRRTGDKSAGAFDAAEGDVNADPDSESAGLQRTRSLDAPLEDSALIDPIIEDYRLSKILQRVDSCKRNAEVAAARGNIDASQLWHLLSISLGTMSISVPVGPEDAKLMNNLPRASCDVLMARSLQTSWRDSAIGLLLLKRVLSLCEQTGGVQTLATIICVLGGPSHVAVLLAGNHPYFSSCSQKSMYAQIEVCPQLLKLQVQYNGVLTAYCNALYSWKRFITCTEIAKRIDFLDDSAAELFLPSVQSHVSLSSMVSNDSGKDKVELAKSETWEDGSLSRRKTSNSGTITMTMKCPTCSDPTDGTSWCRRCTGYSLRCGLCQEGIRGAAIYCPGCMHGGHINHMRQWFGQMEQDFCPTGCGCECSALLKPGSRELDDSESDSDDSYSDHSGPSRMFRSSYSGSSGVDSSEESSSSSEEDNAPQQHRTSAHQRLFQKL